MRIKQLSRDRQPDSAAVGSRAVTLTDPTSAGRVSATSRVATALRYDIATLVLAPGAMLDKAVIAARFGVSRFPVSEAFGRLQTEGLVEIKPQSGTTVSLIRLADARENMFLRRALETEVVAELAGRRDAALMAEAERSLRYQQAAVGAGDREGFHRLDLEFHDLLVSAVGFPRLRSTVEQARIALDRARRLLATPRRHALTHQEHAAILDALAKGDAAAARAAMAAHLDSVMVELEAFAASHPGVFADGGLSSSL